jgi:aldose 1-epimerase
MRCLTPALSLLLAGANAAAQSTLTEEPWGTLPDGSAMTRYTLTNSAGARAAFMPLGAAVLAVEAPDRDGVLTDVVLGFDTASEYLTANPAFIGLTIGRYANRIAGPTFTLDGRSYQLDAPRGRGGAPATMVLHGGPDPFSSRLWTASRVASEDGPGIRFTLVSPDGDQGFPGEVTVSVTYHWSDDFRLSVDYRATTTKPTVVSLTQHSYFNLGGADSGDVLDHLLTIHADFFTFATPDNLPTGEILSVHDTPFDFTVAKPIGRDIDADDPQMRANRGYNQNFVLRRAEIPGRLAEAAIVEDPESGRVLTVSTTEPGLFLYTANFLDTSHEMKGGVRYPLRAGVALETGHFPDSPNQPHFPSTTLMPGQTLQSRTVFAFSTR